MLRCFYRLRLLALSLTCACLVPGASAGEPRQDPVPVELRPLPPLRLTKGDRVIARHVDGAVGVSFSPDGKVLATTGGDALIRLWDLASGKELRQCRGHSGFLRRALFSPDGKLLASGGNESQIRLWEVATGKEVGRLAGHEDGVYQLAWSPDGKTLASGGFDNHLRLWDVTLDDKGALQSGKQLWEKRAHTRVVYALAFAPDGKVLASGGDQDESIFLWETATGKEVRHWKGHAGCVYWLEYSPDGRLLVSGGGDPAARLWDPATGKLVRELEGHPDGCHAAVFGPDGKTLATADDKDRARLWETGSGRQIYEFGPHAGWIWGLAYSPTGRTLATASVDTTVVAWDLATRQRAAGAGGVLLSAKEFETLWHDLAGSDATRAFEAGWALADSPQQALPLLQEHLRPAVAPPGVDAQLVARWLAELDSDQFETRERATQELARAGAVAAPALRKAVAGNPSAEARRRLETLLDRLEQREVPPEVEQSLRAVQVLERIGTAEARRLLEKLARGTPEATLTQEAQAALARLDRRRSAVRP